MEQNTIHSTSLAMVRGKFKATAMGAGEVIALRYREVAQTADKDKHQGQQLQ
jgi:hypothetical protein